MGRYSVREEIKDTAESFYRALSTRNLKTIDKIWAHEQYAAVVGPYGKVEQGWPGVHQFFVRRFQQLAGTTITVRLSNIVLHVVGDVAWFSGTERRTIREGDGVRQEDLRATVVLERKSSGWQIVSYHVSQPAEEPEALFAAS